MMPKTDDSFRDGQIDANSLEFRPGPSEENRMIRLVRKTAKPLFFALVFLSMLVGAQNCGQPASFNGVSSPSSVAPSNQPETNQGQPANNNSGGVGGVGGIDGILFSTYGNCPTGIALQNTIIIQKGTGQAFLTQQDCNKLAAPVPINLQSALYGFNNSNLFVYQNQIYDLQVSGGVSQITNYFCQGTTVSKGEPVQALTWTTTNSTLPYQGSVTVLNDAAESFSAPNTSIAMSPLNGNILASIPGQANAILLQFGSPNTLSFAVNSQTTTDSSKNLVCYNQPVPPPAGVAAPSLVINSNPSTGTLQIPSGAKTIDLWMAAGGYTGTTSGPGGFLLAKSINLTGVASIDYQIGASTTLATIATYQFSATTPYDTYVDLKGADGTVLREIRIVNWLWQQGAFAVPCPTATPPEQVICQSGAQNGPPVKLDFPYGAGAHLAGALMHQWKF